MIQPTDLPHTEIALLQQSFDPDFELGQIGAGIPASFAKYCRVLHPMNLRRSGATHLGKDTSWATIAAASGAVMHPQVESKWLLEAFRTQFSQWELGEPFTGQLWSHERHLLIELLTKLGHHSEDSLNVAFSNLIGGEDYGLTDVTPLGVSREFYLASVVGKHLPDGLTGMVWPQDGSWWVSTDIDLDSTFVGGTRDVIDELLCSPEFEAMPAQLEQHFVDQYNEQVLS